MPAADTDATMTVMSSAAEGLAPVWAASGDVLVAGGRATPGDGIGAPDGSVTVKNSTVGTHTVPEQLLAGIPMPTVSIPPDGTVTVAR
jgi:hypothetical protein